MQTQQRHSYGVIPLIQSGDSFELLVIEQKDPAVTGYWTFAKGTPEKGETPLQTAVRETAEEVGVVCEEVDGEFSFTDYYEFERGDTLIQKSVTYFVGRAPSRDFRIQDAEVVQARWCTPEEAFALLRTVQFRGGKDALSALLASEAPSRLFGLKSL